VIGDARENREDLRIACYRDALYLPVMTGDEFEVRYECAEISPARKRLRMDEEAGELSCGRDEWIDLARETLEVGLLQRALGLDDENPTVAQQLEADHGGAPHGAAGYSAVTGARRIVIWWRRCVVVGVIRDVWIAIVGISVVGIGIGIAAEPNADEDAVAIDEAIVRKERMVRDERPVAHEVSAAAELGSRGGKARAAKLSKEARSEIARRAAKNDGLSGVFWSHFAPRSRPLVLPLKRLACVAHGSRRPQILR